MPQPSFEFTTDANTKSRAAMALRNINKSIGNLQLAGGIDAGESTSSPPGYFLRYDRAGADPDDYIARRHYAAVRARVLTLLGENSGSLNVANVGCGSGEQCRLWAERGHQVFRADFNKCLLGLARERAHRAKLEIGFDVAGATALPWPDRSMDVVLAPALGHFPAWRACLTELVRVLKPGGVLYLDASDKLCPYQQQSSVPLAAWYPGFVGRRCDTLARIAAAQRVGAAAAPSRGANWLMSHALRAHLVHHGMASLDHVDLAGLGPQARARRAAFALLRAVPPLRFCAHLATASTSLLAFKAA